MTKKYFGLSGREVFGQVPDNGSQTERLLLPASYMYIVQLNQTGAVLACTLESSRYSYITRGASQGSLVVVSQPLLQGAASK